MTAEPAPVPAAPGRRRDATAGRGPGVRRPITGDRAPGVLVLTLVLPAFGVIASAAAAFDGWFDRQYAVEMVTTGPWLRVPERSVLTIGEGAIRLEGSQDDVPFVVLYTFGPEVVIMQLLDPVSSSVIAFDFDPAARPVEVDLLAIGSLIVPPDHPSHPCRRWPEQASCSRVGVDGVEGRPAERWELELDDGFGYQESFSLWLDVEEQRVRRLLYADGTQVDLIGYDPGPRPPELFQVPDDYERR